jgi:monofunctional biosynthetic peptidoglycan transglycosylase
MIWKKPLVLVWLLAAAWPQGLSADAKEESMSEPDNLIDFRGNTDPQWRVVNDGVMGGLSNSGIQRTEQGTGLFTGELSLENNGGFASVRTQVGRKDLSAFAGLKLRVRGDGRTYQLRLRTDEKYDGIAYRAFFEAVADQWLETTILFVDFQPSYRGRILTGAPPLNTAAISQVAFMLADRRAGTFSLEIDFVRPHGAAATQP